MALVSPGVQVTVTDESQYLPSAVGSVPFILIATEQNKTINGLVAPGTTKANAGRIYGVNSQRELSNLFGAPKFRRSVTDTPLHGDELNEYGLMAAYSSLGLGNRVWVVRADVNLADLAGSSVRPKGAVPNGTYWLDTGETRWGVFEFNNSIPSTQAPFTNKLPHVLNDLTSVDSNLIPLNSLGDIGDYAVVTSVDSNPVYYKHQGNYWVPLGSENWKSNVAAVVSSKNTESAGLATTAIVSTASFFVNNTELIISSSINSMTEFKNNFNTLVTAAGLFGYEGARATVSNTDRLQIFIGANSKSNGTTVDSKITLKDGNLSPLSRFMDFGTPPATPGNILIAHTGNVNSFGTSWTWNVATQTWGSPSMTFERPVVAHAPYTSAPMWRREMATRKPNGSVWIKTSAEGNGVNIVFKRYTSVSNSFSQITAKVFQNGYTANYNLDKLGGGLNIAMGSVFAMYLPNNDGQVGYRLYKQRAAGQTKVTGTETNITVVAGEQFRLRASQLDGSISDNVCTIPTVGTGTLAHQQAFVQAILNQNIPNVSAIIETTGAISIIHRSGGIISVSLVDPAEDVLGDAGFSSSTPGIVQHIGGSYGDLHITNWEEIDTYERSSATPAADPIDGKLWYYDDPTAVDILINDTDGWKGYRNVSADARGYNLSLTDASGVIISPAQPTTQQTGAALQSGDLWLDSSDLDNYPKIYRYDSASGIWNLIDNTDRVTQNGIIFADARWSHTGAIDPITDPLPSTVTMLTQNGIDLDAPDYRLYPRGTLLFNTRRSGYIVKKYVHNYFNAVAYPAPAVLPLQKSAWVSQIGYKANNNPMMGHYSQRNEIVQAMKGAIDSNTELREEGYNFNILAAPGYPELISNLVTLNTDRSNTGFIIGDTEMTLPSSTTELVNYNRENLVTSSPYLAVYYPSALTNDLSGNEIAVPASHMMLRTFLYNDQVAYQWFAPAGTRRGLIDNASAIGYVNSTSGNFVRTGINNQLRDTLYDNRINPITLLSGVGIVAYGQKTRNPAVGGGGSAMDRVNVARLVNYLRTVFAGVANQFLFEPNDKITRDQIKSLIESLLNDLVAKRGLYDYLVVCDDTNNTSDRIARNELYVDIAIEPMKSVEFIYIPIRLRNPGTIAGTASTTETE